MQNTQLNMHKNTKNHYQHDSNTRNTIIQHVALSKVDIADFTQNITKNHVKTHRNSLKTLEKCLKCHAYS